MTAIATGMERPKHTGAERRGVPAEPLVRIGHIVSVSAAHAIAVLRATAQRSLHESLSAPSSRSSRPPVRYWA
jgi:hypothetical protein